jgi:hypothetical protein
MKSKKISGFFFLPTALGLLSEHKCHENRHEIKTKRGKEKMNINNVIVGQIDLGKPTVGEIHYCWLSDL